jgi:hypothetical protein
VAVKWPEAKWPLIEDVLAYANQRESVVEIEPTQDVRRSCMFVMPTDWAAARVRCIFRIGEERDVREWYSTVVVVRPQAVTGRQKLVTRVLGWKD